MKIEEFHLIKKYPRNTPWYKKIIFNFAYLVSGLVIHQRKNQLSHTDIVKARLMMRKGDIILVGDEKCMFSVLIRSPITHTMLYLGNKKFINATGKGVEYASLHHVFTTYDTLMILRIKPKNSNTFIRKAIAWAKEQYGKPYDFNFRKGADAFFCSELVNEAYLAAGYKTKLRTVKKPKNMLREIVDKVWDGEDALHPEEFVRGSFNKIFMSHNLILEKRKLVYLDEKYQAAVKKDQSRKQKKTKKTTKKRK